MLSRAGSIDSSKRSVQLELGKSQEPRSWESGSAHSFFYRGSVDSAAMVSIFAQILGAAVIVVGAILVEEIISFIIRRAAKLAGASASVTRDIGAGLRVIALLAIVSGILSLTGLASEFSLLTVSGVGAIAVSLALQTTLGNIISGILLFTDGAIRLNDEITFSGIKGKVVRVALRNTWIKTDDGELVIVSNSSLSTGPLINHTAVARLTKKYALE